MGNSPSHVSQHYLYTEQTTMWITYFTSFLHGPLQLWSASPAQATFVSSLYAPVFRTTTYAINLILFRWMKKVHLNSRHNRTFGATPNHGWESSARASMQRLVQTCTSLFNTFANMIGIKSFGQTRYAFMSIDTKRKTSETWRLDLFFLRGFVILRVALLITCF